MNLITAKLEINNARLAASDNCRHHRGPAGVHQRGATYSGGVYDLTNRVDHELGLLLVYVMTAVGIIDEPGAWHLAHEIAYGVVPCVIEQYAELLRLLGRHRQRAVLYVGRQVERFVRLERDKGHRLQGGGGRCLYEVSIIVGPLQVRGKGPEPPPREDKDTQGAASISPTARR